MKRRLSEFYQNHGSDIDDAVRKIAPIQQKYFEFENDRIKFDKDAPVLKQGLTMEDYQKECEPIAERMVTLLM